MGLDEQAFRVRLREGMERNGLSIVALAAQIDVVPRTIERWIAGENPPPVDKAAQIADALGVRLDYLVGMTDEPDFSGAAA